MKNVIVISHASDIDGVGSAALIKMKYGVPTNRIFFTDYAPESLEEISRSITEILTDNTTLFITDLGVNKKTVPVFYSILKSVKDGGGKIFWFDHHPWASDAVKKLAQMCEVSVLGENEFFCATEITRKELGLKDDFTKRFCRIVHFSDFAIKPKSKRDYDLVGAYALSIALYRMRNHEGNLSCLRHMVEVLCSRKMLDKRIRSDADRFRKLNDKHVANMLKDVYLGDEIALGFGEDIQKTYACMKLIEKTGKDIGIYVNLRDRRGHMRSIRNDCTALAVKFGGGGHLHASGFSPNFKKYNNFRSRHDRQRLLSDIELELKMIKKRMPNIWPQKLVSESPAKAPLFG